MHFATAEAQGSISTSPGCFADLFFLEHTQRNETGPMQSFVAIGVCQPIDGRVTDYPEVIHTDGERASRRDIPGWPEIIL